MRVAVWRWLVVFVRRPIHLRDFVTLLQLLRRSMAPRTRAAVDDEPAARERERPVTRPPVMSGRPAHPVQRPSILDVDSEGLEVTEQPIHTLPADLQDELTAATSKHKPLP